MSWPYDADRLSGIVLDSLDEGVSGDILARRAYRSRTQFFRVFRAVIDETPAAMRRRLRLERAAWQLSRTRTLITCRPIGVIVRRLYIERADGSRGPRSVLSPWP
jgi:AraC-like DNA-binding protein